MKALRIHEYGTTPSLDEVPTPSAAAGQVLVRMSAASLNPLDIKIQQGVMRDYLKLAFPYTIGTDVTGVVEQVGTGVAQWQPGDKVVTRLNPDSGGAMAEFVVVPAASLTAAPKAASAAEAAGLPTTGGTAFQGLFETACLTSGQTVLVHAGAGGVGSMAVQLARSAGARVIATASGESLDLARRLGADQVIDYKTEDFTTKARDIDVVLDTVGGETGQRSLGMIRPGGWLVATPSPPDEALAKAHGVKAVFMFHQSDAGRLGKLVGDVDRGSLKVTIDRTYSLQAGVAAFQRQASGDATGKVIVSVP